MTVLLERAMHAARNLPPEMQDNMAQLMLAYVGDGEPVELTPDEEAAVYASRAAALRGEFASEAQMQSIWKKYGL